MSKISDCTRHSPRSCSLLIVSSAPVSAWAENFKVAEGNCCSTNHTHLPTCKAKANGPSKWRRNQHSLHVLYASQAALQYTVHLPGYKQASLRNCTRSLKERRVESLGNLNKSFTVRNTRGLPFNPPYACTGMHRFSIATFFSLFIPNTTNDSLTQPRGELLLGLPTLLTTHHVNAGGNTSAKQP